MNSEQQRTVQHFFNEALRNSLDYLGVKVKEGVSYDLGVESDYYKLLVLFNEHLLLIKKVNKDY